MSAKSTSSDVTSFFPRILFGLAALAMLLQNSPWNGGTWLHIALGIVGPTMFALLALADRKDHTFHKLATVVAILYIALAAVKLFGLAA